MSRYILDTDHVTLFQHNYPEIAQRARTVGGSNIFITTVTLEALPLKSEVISNEIDKLRSCYATSLVDSLVVQTKQDITNKKNYPKPKTPSLAPQVNVM